MNGEGVQCGDREVECGSGEVGGLAVEECVRYVVEAYKDLMHVLASLTLKSRT